VAAELSAADPGRTVTWHIEEGLVASADRGLARVLLANLLGNAWKYTRDAAHPEIALERAVDEGRTDEFRVRDNGVGFDMAHAAQLFAPFRRLHGPQEFEGNGIGLATVHRIVRRHGGEVRARGEPGRGASFCFTLPTPPLPMA
jgi:signal transduction histidine kinase